MSNKVSVFLPTRAGSQRVKNKNTRTFANLKGGLLSIKLRQLLDCKAIDEVVVSTNDSESIKTAEKFTDDSRLKIVIRPDHLAQSTTDLTDLVNYVPTICSHDHVLWTHVTSPLVSSKHYADAIEVYFKNLDRGYDSLMSVKEIQNFIWSKTSNSVVNKKNKDQGKWPRTQDLKKVYEVNSALFLASKRVYLDEKDRVGIKPYLLIHNQIQSTDVDWEEDFKLAEILYENYK
jgi:N-acylneuraminate cytidylyltransferase